MKVPSAVPWNHLKFSDMSLHWRQWWQSSQTSRNDLPWCVQAVMSSSQSRHHVICCFSSQCGWGANQHHDGFSPTGELRFSPGQKHLDSIDLKDFKTVSIANILCEYLIIQIEIKHSWSSSYAALNIILCKSSVYSQITPIQKYFVFISSDVLVTERLFSTYVPPEQWVRTHGGFQHCLLEVLLSLKTSFIPS